MILIFPDHISSLICSQLIEIFDRNESLSSKWGQTSPLEIIHLKDDSEEDFINAKRITQYICNSSIPTFGSSTYVECAQIVKWENGGNQGSHFDDARKNTSLVSITYLNDDFEGGSTILNDLNLSINPQVGKTIYFDGKKYEHQVSKITNGNRYTLAIWYTKFVTESISKDFLW
jgi:hypothetical protein